MWIAGTRHRTIPHEDLWPWYQLTAWASSTFRCPSLISLQKERTDVSQPWILEWFLFFDLVLWIQMIKLHWSWVEFCPADYPNNGQFCIHFRDFLVGGYRVEAEAVQTKFPFADSTRQVDDWSVGMVDGQTKVLIMISIVAFLAELEVDVDKLGGLKNTLSSFQLVRCSYKHFSHPGHHHLLSLSFRVANKFCVLILQVASLISNVCDIKHDPVASKNWGTQQARRLYQAQLPFLLTSRVPSILKNGAPLVRALHFVTFWIGWLPNTIEWRRKKSTE